MRKPQENGSSFMVLNRKYTREGKEMDFKVLFEKPNVLTLVARMIC